MRPLFLLAWSACTSALCAQTTVTHDVVVYGDSAAAVAAAIQAKRQGLDVVLVNSTDFLGGMTCSGLSASDIFHRDAVGGVARELYGRIGQHYGKAYVDYFEPHVAQAAMDGMVKDAGVKVFLNEQLDRSPSGVSKEGVQLKSFRTLSGKVFAAKVFIDASYVGDLMAAAGVSYAVGREPNTLFTETLNGAQRGDNKPRKHYTQKDKDHFIKDIDPYIKAGDPASGLLPFVFAEDPVTGEGDRRIQAYNYRLCVTTDPANRLPFAKPEGYRELDHEMLLRNLEAGDIRFPALLHKLPNGKTDWNSMHAVGTDYVGANWAYPEADYATRLKIEQAHELYIRGHLWTLANHPRVPAEIRTQAAAYGLCKDEFPTRGGFSPMIYIREARRLQGAYVMTELDCKGKRTPDDPVALASFGLDSHAVRYFVTKRGFLERDGVIWNVPPRPYGVSYRSLTPKAEECTNLLVPVCLSATHAAHGSIRMEPVFMQLGQAAAMAAGIAIKQGTSVQAVPYAQIRDLLTAAKLPVQWTAPPATKATPAKK
ncbi:MAG: FAD-dependent oxidoreductase [Verrucomicrobia bacterium]|nr:FAD-dependent oxidoreductase [Verrucomicrobiota bacterium]